MTIKRITPHTYKGFTAQPEGDGFQILPNVAGKIAKFWVVNKERNIRSIFVVARSLLDSVSHDDQPNNQVIEEFLNIIDSAIDNDEVKDLEEYTYEYENGQFLLKNNPSWWQKTLKKYFKK